MSASYNNTIYSPKKQKEREASIVVTRRDCPVGYGIEYVLRFYVGVYVLLGLVASSC